MLAMLGAAQSAALSQGGRAHDAVAQSSVLIHPRTHLTTVPGQRSKANWSIKTRKLPLFDCRAVLAPFEVVSLVWTGGSILASHQSIRKGKRCKEVPHCGWSKHGVQLQHFLRCDFHFEDLQDSKWDTLLQHVLCAQILPFLTQRRHSAWLRHPKRERETHTRCTSAQTTQERPDTTDSRSLSRSSRASEESEEAAVLRLFGTRTFSFGG